MSIAHVAQGEKSQTCACVCMCLCDHVYLYGPIVASCLSVRIWQQYQLDCQGQTHTHIHISKHRHRRGHTQTICSGNSSGEHAADLCVTAMSHLCVCVCVGVYGCGCIHCMVNPASALITSHCPVCLPVFLSFCLYTVVSWQGQKLDKYVELLLHILFWKDQKLQ